MPRSRTGRHWGDPRRRAPGAGVAAVSPILVSTTNRLVDGWPWVAAASARISAVNTLSA